MMFNDIVNRAECVMVGHRLACISAQKWSNMWGKVGLIGLSAKNPDHIREYRNVVEQLQDDNYSFTLFPRDAVDKRGNITVLLLDSFRAFDPTCLPGALFTRNRGLRGTLRATHIKTYPPGEKSRNGQLKDGWRLVLLQGCPAFMRSLEQFETEHKFSIGCGHVFIRGGVRRPSSTSTTTRSGRGRGRGPPPRRQGPGALSDSRRGNGDNHGNTGGRRSSNNNHNDTAPGGNNPSNNNGPAYDRNYPRLTGANSSRLGDGNHRTTNDAPRGGDRAGPSGRADAGPR